jgi:hypothetical protein
MCGVWCVVCGVCRRLLHTPRQRTRSLSETKNCTNMFDRVKVQYTLSAQSQNLDTSHSFRLMFGESVEEIAENFGNTTTGTRTSSFIIHYIFAI